uniref:C-type lectin domain-containing protein n=1 Tax=Acrobeloides nanus TaxID=290746 RepID=A0A914D5F4_9BILA
MSIIIASIILSFLIGVSSSACPYNTLEGPDGRCYGFFPYGFHHNKSEYVCKEYFDGHLASIHDEKLNEFVRSTAQDVFPDAERFWIGGKRENGDDKGWSWTDRSSFDYMNWKNGRPTNEESDSGAVMDTSTGKWSNLRKEVDLPYVCQVNARIYHPF